MGSLGARACMLAVLALVLLLMASAPAAAEVRYVRDESWGESIVTQRLLGSPQGIAVDDNGEVYVADPAKWEVMVFDAGGTLLREWRPSHGSLSISPWSIAVDGPTIFLTDPWISGILKFTIGGNYVRSFAAPDVHSGRNSLAVTPSYLCMVDTEEGTMAFFSRIRTGGSEEYLWSSSGSDSGTGRFDDPSDVAVDVAGTVYVADTSNTRVQKFGADGAFLGGWGWYGAGDGQFRNPIGIAVDARGDVYVTDDRNNRIQKFSPTGEYLTKWDLGSFWGPRDLAVDQAGNVYVVAVGSDQVSMGVQKWVPISMKSGRPFDAGFTATPAIGPAPLTVTFTDTSTGVGITNRSWFFSDNETSTERNPVRTFTAPGVYYVNLTVGNETASDSLTKTVFVTGPVLQLPGGEPLPTDADGDGRYEDVNGNGRLDCADIVLFFNRMDWIAANEPIALFDYNNNGRIDFGDVVWLFSRL